LPALKLVRFDGPIVFYVRYIGAELRRRKGRTVLTALGLGVGVGLVVTVTALSNGLDDAQDEVLAPLTGVGTDMSVTRPLNVTGSGSSQRFTPGGGPPGAGLSQEEQDQLRRENGGARFGLLNRAKPGERFSEDRFVTAQLSFSESEKRRIAALSGVTGVSAGLTLDAIHVSGRVPESPPSGAFAAPAPHPGASGLRSIDLDQSTVSGVDFSSPSLALVTPAQIQNGQYFDSTRRREAIVSQSHARRERLSLGDRITVGGKRFKIIGVSRPPLGGQAADIYIPLGQLQKLSDREGRVNVLQVRAAGGDEVESLAKQIRSEFTGAQVTTAKDLADRVSGSLVDAKNLSNSLGTALAIVALAAAFLIAGLLTLSSVNKRIRELGTLKAIGWSQRLVVRQVTGEALAQGALGGLLGAAIGVGGAALVSAFAPELQATVAEAAQVGPIPFGQGQVASGSTEVALDAPVDAGLIALAVALALVGGAVAGAIGGMRAARLRPAEALRSVE
jgi:ABC-type antimicrobial peptide transport system permease subunit